MPAARKRLTQKRAQEIVDGATLVKAPDWSESSRWHVVAADGTVLVVVSPSYGGAGRSGRDGWRQHLAVLGPSGGGEKYWTRESAAVQGLAAWMRWATSPAQ